MKEREEEDQNTEGKLIWKKTLIQTKSCSLEKEYNQGPTA